MIQGVYHMFMFSYLKVFNSVESILLEFSSLPQLMFREEFPSTEMFWFSILFWSYSPFIQMTTDYISAFHGQGDVGWFTWSLAQEHPLLPKSWNAVSLKVGLCWEAVEKQFYFLQFYFVLWYSRFPHLVSFPFHQQESKGCLCLTFNLFTSSFP